jgi:hypothetical protein
MVVKRLKKKTNVRSRKPKSTMASYVSQFDTNHPDHYIDSAFSDEQIGPLSGVAGTGSLAMNMQMLNYDVPIQLGTGPGLRTGQHIIITRLFARLYLKLSLGCRARVLIMANPRDGFFSGPSMNNNANITAAIESPPYLISPTYGTTYGPIDYMIDPSCEYTVLWDKMYGMGTTNLPASTAALPVGTTSTPTCLMVPVEIDLPLMLPQMYNAAGYPETGDFVFYIVASSTVGDVAVRYTNCAMSGTFRLQYVDASNLEAIGKSIRDFVDEAGNTIDYVVKSRFVRQIANAAPFVTQMFTAL